MILNKYMVGLLQVVLISITALQAAMAGGVTATEAWQLAGLVVGAIVSVFVPLLQGPWAGGLKVGGAILGAIIAAVVPFAVGGWNADALVIVILAGLNALATQLGVSVRIDSVKEKLAPTIVVEEKGFEGSTVAARVEVVDPGAVKALQLGHGAA
jgi:hypothetical protein